MVRRGGSEGEWRVRPSLKYEWVVDPAACESDLKLKDLRVPSDRDTPPITHTGAGDDGHGNVLRAISSPGLAFSFSWDSVRPTSLISKLAGREVLIVGDSINGQVFMSLRNVLMQAVSVANAARAANGANAARASNGAGAAVASSAANSANAASSTISTNAASSDNDASTAGAASSVSAANGVSAHVPPQQQQQLQGSSAPDAVRCSDVLPYPSFCRGNAKQLDEWGMVLLCAQVVCEGGATFTFVRSDSLSAGDDWLLKWHKDMMVPWMQYVRERGDRIAAVVLNRGAHYVEDDKLLPEVRESIG